MEEVLISIAEEKAVGEDAVVLKEEPVPIGDGVPELFCPNASERS